MLILIDWLTDMTNIKGVHPSPVYSKGQEKIRRYVICPFLFLGPILKSTRTSSGFIFYFLTVNIGRKSPLLKNLMISWSKCHILYGILCLAQDAQEMFVDWLYEVTVAAVHFKQANWGRRFRLRSFCCPGVSSSASVPWAAVATDLPLSGQGGDGVTQPRLQKVRAFSILGL